MIINDKNIGDLCIATFNTHLKGNDGHYSVLIDKNDKFIYLGFKQRYANSYTGLLNYFFF